MELIALGLRRDLGCPAPATLDRRIASWSAFHRMRNLVSPFTRPLVSQARQKARRANATPRVPKSPKPVTRDVLEALVATCDASHRGLRDRAMLMLAFASGGRRRSEVTALNVEDIGRDDFADRGLIWVDYYTAMDAGDGSMRSEYTKDGVHPTPEGYDVMERIVLPALAHYCPAAAK